MEGFILLVVVAVIVIVIKSAYAPNQKDSYRHFPYEKQNRLLTPAERSFFGVLEQAVGDSYRIFAKVRLGDLFKVKPKIEPKEKLRAFNKISAKHVDFVICSPDSIDVLAAIELDDKSHASPKRKIRDEFVNQVFEGAGVPLGRVPAKKAYNLVDVYGVLSQILETDDVETEENENETDFAFGDNHNLPSEYPKFQFTVKSKPLCPSCGNDMVKKQEGQEESIIWVCTKAPVCGESLSAKASPS